MGAQLLGHMSDNRVELNRCQFPVATSRMFESSSEYMNGKERKGCKKDTVPIYCSNRCSPLKGF